MNIAKRKGFTLIELLVVIAIIAILSTIGLSAFTSAQQRARDARRRGDIKSVQDAAEQYYVANNYLYVNGGCDMAKLGTVNYLEGGVLPKDPQDPAKTYACSNSTTASYCYCATLEAGSGGNSGAGCTFSAATKDNFCVRNLQ